MGSERIMSVVAHMYPEAVRARNNLSLNRRLRFQPRHPEVRIRATRADGGRLVFFVTEPGKDEAAWSDCWEMMDDLEARYPDGQ